jgi:hypothetical protein
MAIPLASAPEALEHNRLSMYALVPLRSPHAHLHTALCLTRVRGPGR